MSSDRVKDLLQTYLPLPAILSLLAAVAIGVFTCANTLNDIRGDAKETRNELWTAKKEINDKLDIQSHVQDKQGDKIDWLQSNVTTLTVQSSQMQKQLDRLQP